MILPSDAMLFRENEASENPDLAWGGTMKCPIANFRVDMRERDQSNQILH